MMSLNIRIGGGAVFFSLHPVLYNMKYLKLSLLKTTLFWFKVSKIKLIFGEGFLKVTQYEMSHFCTSNQ